MKKVFFCARAGVANSRAVHDVAQQCCTKFLYAILWVLDLSTVVSF